MQRRNDKTINNKIGEFHQNLLGRVPGWVNLGTSDESGCDLKKEDNSIFIELKNKHNTLNSTSLLGTREKLESVSKQYPNATVYWAYIIEKNYNSRNEVWEYHEKDKNKNVIIHIDEKIKLISGSEVYTLITGDSTAFNQLINALPNAINYTLVDQFNEPPTTLSKNDEGILGDYFDFILDR